MVKRTQENGELIKCMEWELIPALMVDLIQVNLLTIRENNDINFFL